MAQFTYDDTKALEAVNEMLAGIGQAPVTSIQAPINNPDVAIAYDTLKWVSREVQSEGWSFNKELEYPFTPDPDNEIVIPFDVIQLDLSDYYNASKIDVVRRGGKLYDKTNHTFTFTDTVYCDVIWEFAFTDLPGPAYNYIVSKAAVNLASRIVGDPQLIQVLAQKESYNRASLLEYECNQGDYNFLGHPRGGNFYNSYEPFNALYR